MQRQFYVNPLRGEPVLQTIILAGSSSCPDCHLLSKKGWSTISIGEQMAKTGALLRPGWSIPAWQLRAPQQESAYAPLPVPGLSSLLNQGLHPGSITQIVGERSSGRTALGLHILAQATGRGEICAIVDGQNNFHVESAIAAGIHLDHLVWIRCNGQAENAMRSADLLLHSGGFGIIWLDLCEVSPRALNRIPLSYWFRFQRALENTATTLLVCGDQLHSKSSVSKHIQLKVKAIDWGTNLSTVCFVKTSATLQKSAGLLSQSLCLQAAP